MGTCDLHTKKSKRTKRWWTSMRRQSVQVTTGGTQARRRPRSFALLPESTTTPSEQADRTVPIHVTNWSNETGGIPDPNRNRPARHKQYVRNTNHKRTHRSPNKCYACSPSSPRLHSRGEHSWGGLQLGQFGDDCRKGPRLNAGQAARPIHRCLGASICHHDSGSIVQHPTAALHIMCPTNFACNEP
jgi:hypothetical protein